MTDQELKDLVAQLVLTQENTSRIVAETSREVAETSREVAETTRVVKEVSRRLGSMGENLGAVTESFFYNALKAKLDIGGVAFDTVSPHVILGGKGTQNEFDLVLVNGASVAIVEVKFKAHLNDLDQVERKINSYRALQPAYKDFAIYGGIATQSIAPDVMAAAKERGFFVLEQVGNVMTSNAQGMRAH